MALPKHHKKNKARCCYRHWRICKWSRAIDGAAYGNTHASSRTKLFCRSNECWLGHKANFICTAYANAEKFFPSEKVHLTGNPVREAFTKALPEQSASKTQLGFMSEKPLLLILGGSLGASEVNKHIDKSLQLLKEQGWQLLWQCDKLYEKEYVSKTQSGVVVSAFTPRH